MFASLLDKTLFLPLFVSALVLPGLSSMERVLIKGENLAVRMFLTLGAAMPPGLNSTNFFELPAARVLVA